MSSAHSERKNYPVFRGVLALFPRAVREIARVMQTNQDRYNPGAQSDDPIVWDRSKSKDHADCLSRHLLDAGKLDETDGMRHTAKTATRALMLLEEELEGVEEADGELAFHLDEQCDDSIPEGAGHPQIYGVDSLSTLLCNDTTIESVTFSFKVYDNLKRRYEATVGAAAQRKSLAAEHFVFAGAYIMCAHIPNTQAIITSVKKGFHRIRVVEWNHNFRELSYEEGV